MRVDKFLKLSRIVKRRTVAQEMAEAGAVRVSGRVAKPSTEVKDGDLLEVDFPSRFLKVRVLTADEAQLKRKATPFEVLEDRKVARDDPW
ncbi:ribosome-associated heat shock protein implicated in recycling of 50S subunit [Thermanaerovibrio velox DSM 12556]|uniref:RQC P-site tRNA stabilizing factor n=1 Tax=Thermanaerovibrio velox DSM 12556 TaxID=926567 RepID=H0UQE9_9BACT|nr:S4 domain-containing protein [Thermanaerovibrio velox]EHM09703.1 ribosome-associated heat shock protein implicated in recycling of 50S subunit [Thermanaerovibrio velox DSM 12556]